MAKGSGVAPRGSWGGLAINAGGNASLLEHVVVEYGKGLQINNASPVLNHVTLRGHQGAAVRLDATASPIGVGNSAQDNDVNAILVAPGVVSGSVTWGLRGIPYLLQTGTLSVGAPPLVQGMSPASLQVGQSASIAVTGTRLSGLTQPRFDRRGVSAEVVGSPTAGAATLRVTAAPDADVGLATFSALTDAGELVFADAFSIVALQPELNNIVPSKISVAQGPVEVVLSGLRFAEASSAMLNGDLIPSRYISATELAATIPNQPQIASLSVRVRTEDAAKPGNYFVSNEALLAVEANKLALSPATASLVVGAQHALTLRLAHPAPVGGVEIDLKSNNPAVLSVPSPVIFAAGEQEKNVVALAAAAGSASVTATRTGFASAVANATVVAPPTLDVEPVPLAIPPDAVSRPFKLKLSRADTIAHVLTLASVNSAVAEVTPTQLQLEAGQTSITVSIKGKLAGQTKVVITSPTLATVEVPVFVTADYRALSVSFAPPLGVVVAEAPQPPIDISVGPLTSRLLGINVGAGYTALAPDRITVGTTEWIALNGMGLGDIRNVSFRPGDGMTAGVPEPAADGRSVRVQVAVSADAEPGLRTLVVTDGQGKAVPAATAAAERLLLTRPLPAVHSIAPLHALAGQNVALTVRGKHLQGASAMRLLPGEGLVLDDSPVIAPDGSSMTLQLQVGAAALPGSHVLVLETAAGTSSETAGPNNTFKVVQQINQTLGPVVSSVLGVSVGSANNDVLVPTNAFAPELGVIWGSGISAVSPNVGVVGTSFTLRLSGNGLASLTELQALPPDGIQFGSPVVSADGRQVDIPVVVAVDAPHGLRELRAMAGTNVVRFSSAELERLRIVAPLPVVESVTPNYLLLGANPVSMTVRGRNLAQASEVRLQPGEGMSISPPVVAGDGLSLTVTVSAAAAAVAGDRVVMVTTPAGDSTGVAMPANKVTLSSQVLSSVSPIAAPVVGVRVGNEAQAQPYDGLLLAGPVGVRVGEEPVVVPVERTVQASASLLGVSVGAVLDGVDEWSGFLPGASGTLTYTGVNLQSLRGALALPAAGVTLGAVVVAPDGRSLTLPISVAADALPGWHTIALQSDTGTVSALGRAPTIKISEGIPELTSMSPIVAKQGETTSLVFRGNRLRLVEGLRFTPAVGVAQSGPPQWSTDTFGEKLTVPVSVASDAALGAFVVQLWVAGGESDGTAGPTNTLTIIAP